MNDKEPKPNATIAEILQDLLSQVPGLQGALLVSPDGLLAGHYLHHIEEVERAAAMSTAIHAVGKGLDQVLNLGGCNAVRVHCAHAQVTLVNCGRHTLVFLSEGNLEIPLLSELAAYANHRLRLD